MRLIPRPRVYRYGFQPYSDPDIRRTLCFRANPSAGMMLVFLCSPIYQPLRGIGQLEDTEFGVDVRRVD